MQRSYIISSESVSDGHPDKVADQISDSILDDVIRDDADAHVACETLITDRRCVVVGEIRTSSPMSDERYAEVARNTVLRIGYDRDSYGFNANTAKFLICLGVQSPDIAQGVDGMNSDSVSEDPDDRQGAGDQGLMYGFACNETASLMPMSIHLAHRLAQRISENRRAGAFPYLGPDGKTQVSLEYEGFTPVAVKTVLVSVQHEPLTDYQNQLRPDLMDSVVRPILADEGFDAEGVDFLVNPTGAFVEGGPKADTGLTGRKIIVDSYGGVARHGGGAFSGKDPSKVDRSAAYAARWVAKNVVASGAATRCEVQVAYAIGRSAPVSIMVETFGTAVVDPIKVDQAVREVFDLRPAVIIRELDLCRPIFAKTAAFGHFGREDSDFTWERTDRTKDLSVVLGL